MELRRNDKVNRVSFAGKNYPACAQGTDWQSYKRAIKAQRPLEREDEEALFKVLELKNKADALLQGKIEGAEACILVPGWPGLAEDARRARCGELKAKAEDAKKQLVEASLPQVLYLAEKYYGRIAGVARIMGEDDLFNEGCLGLAKAVASFDRGLGLRLKTYADKAIKRAMERAVQNKDRNVRLPVWQQQEAARVGRERARLAVKLNRTPAPKELAEHMGITPEQLGRLEATCFSEAYLDAPYGAGEEATLAEFIPCSAADLPEACYERRELRALTEEVLGSLEPRESLAVRMYHGFYGKKYTYKEIAIRLELSSEGARKLYLRAVKKYKSLARARDLYAFLESA